MSGYQQPESPRSFQSLAMTTIEPRQLFVSKIKTLLIATGRWPEPRA
jgi:hypothetical protein